MTPPWKTWLRNLPMAGHPITEAVVERLASREAYRVGRVLARVLHKLAPHMDPVLVADSFSAGMRDAREPEPHEARVYPFPGR